MNSDMDATKGHFLMEVGPILDEPPHNKVTIVGVGQVGMACAFSIFQHNIAREIALIDVDENKLKGEMMDLQHGRTHSRNCVVKAGTDYAISAGSKVCIVTAGCRQREGESRLSLVQRNVEIFRGIITNLIKYSPNTILFIITNPVDVLTYVAWKLSGLPREKVFGSGTSLDSARFRFLLSEHLQISSSDCNAWIIGEHGDSSVAVWSAVNIAGVHLSKVRNDIEHIAALECTAPTVSEFDSEPFIIDEKLIEENNQATNNSWESSIHRAVVQSAYEIIRLKGYTSWAIGLTVCDIVAAIMHNSRQIYALSTNSKGLYGITNDVFLSIPCVLGSKGLTHVIRQDLKSSELEQIQKSAQTLLAVQNSLNLGSDKSVLEAQT